MALAAAFAKYDVDSSGELDVEELSKCFADLATTLLSHHEGTSLLLMDGWTASNLRVPRAASVSPAASASASPFHRHAGHTGMEDDVKEYMLDDVGDFSSEAAASAFESVDKDKSGGISIDELKTMMASGELAKALSGAAGDINVEEAAEAAALHKTHTSIRDKVFGENYHAHELFSRYDDDESAKLESNELVSWAARRGGRGGEPPTQVLSTLIH